MKLKNKFLISISLLLIIFLSAASFDIGIQIVTPDVSLDNNLYIQSSFVQVNGSDVIIRIPLIYNINLTSNVSLLKNLFWSESHSWRIFENGSELLVTENATHIFWTSSEFNNSYAEFKVLPPKLNITHTQSNPGYFASNFTVSSPNHFTNVSASIPISGNHTLYNLYWFDGNSYVDKTVSYNLQVSDGLANLSNFNTSTQYFYLEAFCSEVWSCTAWSGSECGTRSCTDQNSCGTQLSKPITSKSCGGSSPVYSTFYANNVSEESFTFLPASLKIELFPNDKESYPISIFSNADKTLRFFLELEPADSFLSISKSSIRVSPGQEESFNLNFNVPENQELKDYDFKLKVILDKEVLFTINISAIIIENKTTTELFVEDKQYESGEEFDFNYKLVNFESLYGLEGELIFYLKDGAFVKKILKKERIILDSSFNKKLNKELQFELDSGFYNFCTDLYVNNTLYTQCESLEVIKPVIESPSRVRDYNFWFVIIIVLLVMALLSISLVFAHNRLSNRVISEIPYLISSKNELLEFIESLSKDQFDIIKGEELSDFIESHLGDSALAKKIKSLKSKNGVIHTLSLNIVKQKSKLKSKKFKSKPTKIKSKPISKSSLKSESKPNSKSKDKTLQKTLNDYKTQVFKTKPSTPEEYFHLVNNVKLTCVEDFVSYLQVMPETVFSYHVTVERNDFASWVEHVFGFDGLAVKLRMCRTKDQMIKVLDSYVHPLKHSSMHKL